MHQRRQHVMPRISSGIYVYTVLKVVTVNWGGYRITRIAEAKLYSAEFTAKKLAVKAIMPVPQQCGTQVYGLTAVL